MSGTYLGEGLGIDKVSISEPAVLSSLTKLLKQ